MKYVDYREKLGLGFNNKAKTSMLYNKITEFLKKVHSEYQIQKTLFDGDIAYMFCQEVGESSYYGDLRDVMDSIKKENDIAGLISKFIVLVNLGTKEGTTLLFDLLKNYIESLNLQYQTIKDKDGYFIFPKGAKELDDALKDYSNLTDDNASDVADKFRKALERFFQEFFGKDKSLENLKSDYGAYMKGKGVPAELSNNLEALLQAYTNFMNSYAKHHSKTNKNLLEYIMYQTGNIIRLLISIKGVE